MVRRIKHVTAVPPEQAQGLVTAVYAQLRADFGRVAEPLAVHSPSPTLLAGVWSALRQHMVVGEVPRGVKESVASTVSAINRCPYCVDVHTMLARAGGYRDAAGAVDDFDDFDASDGFGDRQLTALESGGGSTMVVLAPSAIQ